MRTKRYTAVPAVSAALTLCLLLTGCVPFGIHVGVMGNYSYKEAGDYTEYADGPVRVTEEIRKISADWIAGDVILLTGEELSITEEDGKSGAHPLYWRVRDGELSIRFVRSGTENKEIDGYSKTLTVTVPASVRTVELDLVSASYRVETDGLDLLDVDTVSGSGSVQAGTLGKLVLDTVSGSLNAHIRDTDGTERLDVDSVSGSAEFILDGDRKVDAGFHSVSGKLDSDMELSSDEDALPVHMDSVSGSLVIRKGTAG